MVSTFSEMAEEWIRANLPTMEPPQTTLVTTEDMSSHSPDAWREDFARWLAESCICREGRDDWTGIGALLRDFMEWCLAHDTIPCQRPTLETLLSKAGFQLQNDMAGGLLLRLDWEAHCSFQDARLARH